MDAHLRALLEAAYEAGRAYEMSPDPQPVGFNGWLKTVDAGDLVSAAAGVPLPTERIPLTPWAVVPFVDNGAGVNYVVMTIRRTLEGGSEAVLIPEYEAEQRYRRPNP